VALAVAVIVRDLVVVVIIVIAVVAGHLVLVYRDASFVVGRKTVGIAYAGAHTGGVVAAAADDRSGRDLRDEDQVALGVGRHRMRAGALRDRLDQRVRRGVDHAEHRLLLGRGGGGGRSRETVGGSG